MTRRVLGVALMALALSFGMVNAARIQPELVSALANAGPDQKVAVSFVMKDQAPALTLDPNIPNLPKPERRARVAKVLSDYAAASQHDLLALLKTSAAAGKVNGLNSIWLVNEVACFATRDVVYELANRDDVSDVLYDLVPVKLERPKLAAKPPARDGVEPNLLVTQAPGAWKLGYTGQNVVVGEVDTGIWYTHQDLANHLWTSPAYPHCGFNYGSSILFPGGVNPSPYDTLDPIDYVIGHGTHCAGIVSADGTYGNGVHDTMGVAPSAKMLVCPSLVYFNSVPGETLLEQSMFLGFQFCISPPRDPTNGADVITTSLGLFTSNAPRYANYRFMERNIQAAGVSHCIAAGNEGPDPQSIRTPGNCPPPWPNPANHPTDTATSACITVGATDNSDNAASFTSIGPSVIWPTTPPFNDYDSPYLMDPDICAPGVGILSTFWQGDQAYTTMSGTSMATPAAAGCIALMLSKNPNLTPRMVDSILEVCAVRDLGPSGKDVTYGAGRINCSLAVVYTPLPGPSHNLALASIIEPGPKVDPSVPLAPKVLLVNAGTYHETSIPVHLTIDSLGSTVYNQTITVPSLDSAAIDTVTFPNWTPSLGGNVYNVTTWHSYTPDTNRTNDTLYLTVRVRGHDVASVATNLTGFVRSGTPVAPTLTLADSGDFSEYVFDAICQIDSAGTQVYFQVVAVDSILLGGARTVSFPDWTPGPDAMVYDVTLFHMLSADQRHVNDTLHSTVATRGHDIASVSMNIGGRVRAEQPYSPMLTVRSADYTETSVTCYCWIDSSGARVYNQSVVIDSVPANSTATGTFPLWNVGPVGTHYSVTMFNTFADPNHNDDTLHGATEATDQMRVLIAYADVGGTPDTLIKGLTALGDSIDLFDAAGGTPTLAQLQDYDGVITFTDNTYSDPTGMGNVLADYVDLGRSVVEAQFALTTGWGLAGRITTGDYLALTLADLNFAQHNMGWYNAAHPIMNGVTASSEFYRGSCTWAAGADSVAKWEDGVTYVATSANQRVVGINSYPGYVSPERLTGEWVLVYHNALLWAASGTGLEEKPPLSLNPDFTLCQSKPNPFSNRTTIRFSVPHALDVNIAVYDLSGRLVTTLVKGKQTAGWHSVTWNRADGQGNRVASGVYFYKLTSGTYRTTRKLVVE